MAIIKCQGHCFEDIQAVIFDKDGTLANVEPYLRLVGEARSHCIEAQVPRLYLPVMQALGIDENGIDPTGLMAVGSREENKIATAAYVAAAGYGWTSALAMVEKGFSTGSDPVTREGHSNAFARRWHSAFATAQISRRQSRDCLCRYTRRSRCFCQLQPAKQRELVLRYFSRQAC